MGFPGGLRLPGQALSGRRRVRVSQPQAQERLGFPGAGEEEVVFSVGVLCSLGVLKCDNRFSTV